VEVDTDGDGIPDTSDGSGLMKGSTASLSGGGGAKIVNTWPYSDSNNSHYYPNNTLTGLPGKEVYYAYTNTTSGRVLKADALPRLRGDYFETGTSGLFDIGVWIYFPVAGRFCCYHGSSLCDQAYGTSGWTCSNVAAGSWHGCDSWGAGWDECAYVESASNATYIFAVDGYTAVPDGGWYTMRLYTPPAPFPR
jgi:hypothetical protein